jgi:hypothetical protein
MQPPISSRSLQELHSVRVDDHGARPDDRAERDLVVAEGVVVRPLEPQATRDADLQRRPVAEVDDLLGRRDRGVERRRHVDRLVVDRDRVAGGEGPLPDVLARPVLGLADRTVDRVSSDPSRVLRYIGLTEWNRSISASEKTAPVAAPTEVAGRRGGTRVREAGDRRGLGTSRDPQAELAAGRAGQVALEVEHRVLQQLGGHQGDVGVLGDRQVRPWSARRRRP